MGWFDDESCRGAGAERMDVLVIEASRFAESGNMGLLAWEFEGLHVVSPLFLG